MTAPEASAVVVSVRPKFSLLVNAAAALFFGTAPILAVAYWFTSSRGGTELVALVTCIVLAVALMLVGRQLAVYCAVTETELVGNGIFTPLMHVPLADIREVHLVPTHLGAAPEPVLQLLVSGENSRRLFRMRGNYWNEADLVALAEALPVRVERVAEPMTLRDFLRAYPGSAFWFERRRAVRIAIITLAVLAGSALLTVIMRLLDLPVRFLF